MRITFRVTAGIFKGKEFSFSGHDTFLVGRSKHTHLRLPTKDRTCSRIHFMVEINPPRCRLLDMGSHNGTYVNDERIQVVELKHGDKIRAGGNILRVKVHDSPPPGPDSSAEVNQPAPPPAQAAPPPMTQAPLAVAARPPAGPSVDKSLIPPPAPVQSALPVAIPVAQPSLLPTAPAPVGPTIPGYRLLRQLGEGAMGVVYLAERSADGSKVALKTIRPAVATNHREIERFLREAKILRELNHPHIVGFRDMGESDGCLWFAMDYVTGPDALQLVKQASPLAIGRAVTLTCQLLEALEFAHGRGFVHRDIKPSNVLIATADGREAAKLADFGLARVYQGSQLSGLTMTGEVGGTPAFMAPEQLVNFRESPPSVDQYAAAATLYFLLTRRFLFDVPKEMHLLFGMILNDDPVPIRDRRPDVPAGLARVIHRAVARDPEDRYTSVAEMRPALEPFRAAT
jgi:serine/threonine-protein kinase